MTLEERIDEALEDFKAAGWRDDWDTTIVAQQILPARRGPGMAVFTTIRDGITIETAILPGDHMAATMGQELH